MKNGNEASTSTLPKPAAEPGLSFTRATVLAETVPTPFLVLAPSRITRVSGRYARACLESAFTR